VLNPGVVWAARENAKSGIRSVNRTF
jgi:hypothetical protein